MRLAMFALLPALATVLAADPDPIHLVMWDQPGSARISRYGHAGASRSATASWSAALAERPPTLLALDAHRLLAVWSGPAGSWCATIALHAGRLHELASGPWPSDWRPQGAADFDGDGRLDVLVSRTRGEGDGQSFDVQIALAQPDGAFAFDGPVITVLDQKRGAYFAVGDLDGDGRPDLVYHGYDYGGSYETQLYLLKGLGGGRLAALEDAKLVLTSPHAATTPLLGDFDGDGDTDVFLPPDDDVDDLGQAHVALNPGNGTLAAPTPSLDFAPDREDGTADEFVADGRVADFDGDGRPDLLICTFDIPRKTYRMGVHRGLGKGELDATPTMLGEGSTAAGPTPSLGWIRPVAVAPDRLPAVDLAPLWAALGAERAADAGPAIRGLEAAGAARVPWIERQLELAAPFDVARVTRLVAELDSASYSAREQATRALIDLGEAVDAPLRAALATATSLEVQSRLKLILQHLAERPADQVGSDDDRRALRALAVLEADGSEQARALVKRIAAEGPSPFARRAAGRAWKRLDQRD